MLKRAIAQKASVYLLVPRVPIAADPAPYGLRSLEDGELPVHLLCQG